MKHKITWIEVITGLVLGTGLGLGVVRFSNYLDKKESEKISASAQHLESTALAVQRHEKYYTVYSGKGTRQQMAVEYDVILKQGTFQIGSRNWINLSLKPDDLGKQLVQGQKYDFTIYRLGNKSYIGAAKPLSSSLATPVPAEIDHKQGYEWRNIIKASPPRIIKSAKEREPGNPDTPRYGR